MLAQGWRDVLFAHWAFPPALVRPLLPRGIVLDTFDGRAWLGVIPFRMTGVRLRGLPPVPGASAFPELNVRTYVTVGETRGVLFFSLDATSRLAIAGARAWFGLPYFRANMSVGRADHDPGAILYRSSRVDARGAPAAFEATYAPDGDASPAARGTLEHWLTERYVLYATKPGGRILRGDVHHAPWPLQRTRAAIRVNTMLAPLGLDARGVPDSLLFARGVDVATWTPREVYRAVAREREH